MTKDIHLIGIGGIGMSAIAQLLLNKGWRVSGCDLKENELIKNLRQIGASVWIGHNPQHLEAVDTLVYSSAIPADNPEIQEARRRGIRLMKRAQILSLLMQDKTVVTVTGMHGKTTTASLASHLLSEAGLFPTIAVGGILQNLGGNALMGEGRFFVAEADESDGSFLYYHPDYSIITNIDYEHLDYYKDFDSVLETFRRFINQTMDGGCLFCWRDDAYLSNLLRDYKRRVVFFGLGENAELYALNIKFSGLTSEFDCLRDRRFIGHFRIGLGGRHNILNALAVVALGLELGIEVERISSALINYQGTRRRLQVKFKSKEFLVLDDYGHHPTEIKATIEAARLLNPGRLLVIFQPHRYTRTKLLLDSFASSFDFADFVIITDTYPAGEAPIKGANGYSIYEKLKARQRLKKLKFLQKEKIVDYVLKVLNPADVILVLGAGDITCVGDELAEVLKREVEDKRALSRTYQL
jgi:UDP-N-acetylmuramate--alanine ligase